MLHAIVMAGGSGTRFWPASRASRPKQLLELAGSGSMINNTVSRLGGLVPPDRTLVVTNARLVKAIGEQLPELPAEAILGEPCKRDTAPCVGIAAAVVSKQDPDAIMAVMPADHVITTPAQFQDGLRQAVAIVEQDPRRLVTFGIKPTYPAESFGYIERGTPLENTGQYLVKQFREKPKAELAQEFLAAQTFYWNSGIFVWSAQTILDLLAEHEPQMFAHIRRIGDAIGKPEFSDVFRYEFEQIEGKSIDYAVMERAKEVAVIEAPFQWDDVGSWQSLERLHTADQDGNTIVGTAITSNTSGSVIRTEGDHIIATVGMKDCIIVHTPDATLVADKHDEESVRKIVKLLEAQGLKEYL